MKTAFIGILVMFAVLGGLYVITEDGGNNSLPTQATPAPSPLQDFKIN